MNVTGQYEFREIQYRVSAFSMFQVMRDKKEFTDVVIKVGNRSFSAHRIVLAARIPNLPNIKSDVVIHLPGMDADIFESILDFAYDGRLTITAQNVRPLIMATGVLDLDKVRKTCWKFLERRISLENVLEIHSLAKRFHNVKLVRLCNSYLRQASSRAKRSLSCSFDKKPRKYRKTEQLDSEEFQTEEDEQKPETPRKTCNRSPSGMSIRKKRHEGNQSPEALQLHDVRDGIYAISCYGSSEIVVNHYEPETKRWFTLPVAQGNQDVCGVAAVDDKIYVFFSETIKVFHLLIREWSSLDSKHLSADGSGVVYHMGKIYLFGGKLPEVCKTVRCFDPCSKTWLSDDRMNERRCMGVTSAQQYVYLTGGFCLSRTNVSSNTFERYDPLLMQWKKLRPMITKRANHGCCSVDSKIYVCGGFKTMSLSSAEVYNCKVGQWCYIDSMSICRHSLAAVVFRERIYALGGMSEDFDCTRSVEIYDSHPKTKRWKSANSMPSNKKPVLLTKAVAISSLLSSSSSSSSAKKAEKCKCVWHRKTNSPEESSSD